MHVFLHGGGAAEGTAGAARERRVATAGPGLERVADACSGRERSWAQVGPGDRWGSTLSVPGRGDSYLDDALLLPLLIV